jgi:hypothetical protein
MSRRRPERGHNRPPRARLGEVRWVPASRGAVDPDALGQRASSPTPGFYMVLAGGRWIDSAFTRGRAQRRLTRAITDRLKTEIARQA